MPEQKTPPPRRTAGSAGRELRIDARIDAKYGIMPPQERRVADFLLEHLGDLAIFSAADISRETGVSKATVSRLFRKLDFDDFKMVKDHARALRHGGLPTASPVRSGGSEASAGLSRHQTQEHENITRMVSAISGGRLSRAVELICAAERITIVGLRNSYPVALHLHQQLIQARGKVRVAPQPGQTLGEELTGLSEGDLVIAVGFRRRPAVFSRLISLVEASPARILCIGDGTSRRYASQVECWLECSLDSDGAFDSYASAMSLVGMLANSVLNENPSTAGKRVSAIAAAYDELEELEL